MGRITDLTLLGTDLVDWLNEQRTQAGMTGFAVGLSGGVDSAVVAALCQRTGAPTMAMILPCESSPEELVAAKTTAQMLGLVHDEMPLEDLWQQLLLRLLQTQGLRPLPDIEADEGKRQALEQRIAGNLKSRLRMASLYFIANAQRSLVVSSATRNDISLGYLTKFGDQGAADLLPLANLLKSEVRQLAYFLGVPPAVAGRQPTADLWEGQTDEQELGLSYELVEPFLRIHGDDDFASAGYITYLNLQPHEVKIVQALKGNQHKVRPAPRFELSLERYAPRGQQPQPGAAAAEARSEEAAGRPEPGVSKDWIPPA